MNEEKYLTVNQITQYIKAKFVNDPYLKEVYVTGEISNYKKRANTHQYFSIKDEQALLSVVMFKSNFSKVDFELEEGMKVRIKGHIDVFASNGRYQFYADKIEPDGIGLLYQKYEQLKKALAKEGYFDFEHKSIPRFPKKIAVITSRSGAVIHDILTTVKRRYPIVQIVLYPTAVQGDNAAPQIVKHLQQIEADGGYDTVIIGRGGGSIEDLWPFNERSVVEQVAKMSLPVISSVGHETDFTLVDFVSDQRAPTPTAAAEMATPVMSEELHKIKEKQIYLIAYQNNRLKNLRDRVTKVQNSHILQHPTQLYDAKNVQLDTLNTRLIERMSQIIKDYQQAIVGYQQHLNQRTIINLVNQRQQKVMRLQEKLQYVQNYQLQQKQAHARQLVGQLDALSPLKQLSKGFGYISKHEQPVRTINDVEIGDFLAVQLMDGKINAQVTGTQRQQIQAKRSTEL